MSSTNVHSIKDNPYCAGAQMTPTEKSVEIPPKTAKKGPTFEQVKMGEGLEIPLTESRLQKDGKLVDTLGKPVVTFAKQSFETLAAKKQKTNDGDER